MLIVKESQIQHCDVLYTANGTVKKVPGISHERHLFTCDAKFEVARHEAALAHCRSLFSKTQGQARVLLVENETHSTVWVENPYAQRAKPAPDPVKKLNLEDVVAQMRTVGGIKIRTRTYRLKDYFSCFTGIEAVRWFMHRYPLTQPEALRLGQRLIDEQWIHHVTDSHSFKDEELFYRFFWDEA